MPFIRAEIHDKQLRAKLTEIEKNLKIEPTIWTKEIARDFKNAIIRRIESRTKFPIPGKGHNTPIPLRKLLHFQKSSDGYRVFFDKSMNEDEVDLAKIVEYGTKKHFQFTNPFYNEWNGKWHPGADPRYFWRDSVKELPYHISEVIKKRGPKLLK